MPALGVGSGLHGFWVVWYELAPVNIADLSQWAPRFARATGRKHGREDWTYLFWLFTSKFLDVQRKGLEKYFRF